MRGDVTLREIQFGGCNTASESVLNGRDCFAIPLGKMSADNFPIHPAAHVCEEALRKRHRRLPLVGLSFADFESIEYTVLQIDI